ncbi:hypothetical protein TRIUR3_09772 [Triticum urartu]|uniref:Uncharacterized protein n=1 Tax=Triticum urartu TaxID=4572 RepID=M8AG47_TRIUA|nr:hypothetical protein TRIUR3_09772 [Triticum urartu]
MGIFACVTASSAWPPPELSFLTLVNAVLPRFLLLMPLRGQSPNSENNLTRWRQAGLSSRWSSKMLVALRSAKLWQAFYTCSYPCAATHTSNGSTVCRADRCL